MFEQPVRESWRGARGQDGVRQAILLFLREFSLWDAVVCRLGNEWEAAFGDAEHVNLENAVRRPAPSLAAGKSPPKGSGGHLISRRYISPSGFTGLRGLLRSFPEYLNAPSQGALGFRRLGRGRARGSPPSPSVPLCPPSGPLRLRRPPPPVASQAYPRPGPSSVPPRTTPYPDTRAARHFHPWWPRFSGRVCPAAAHQPRRRQTGAEAGPVDRSGRTCYSLPAWCGGPRCARGPATRSESPPVPGRPLVSPIPPASGGTSKVGPVSDTPATAPVAVSHLSPLPSSPSAAGAVGSRLLLRHGLRPGQLVPLRATSQARGSPRCFLCPRCCSRSQASGRARPLILPPATAVPPSPRSTCQSAVSGQLLLRRHDRSYPLDTPGPCSTGLDVRYCRCPPLTPGAAAMRPVLWPSKPTSFGMANGSPRPSTWRRC